jgi:hypothetical protein
MRLAILLVMGLGLGASAYARNAPVEIDATLVKKIERQMVLPQGASPLKDYARFYAPGRIDGRDLIEGVYVGGGGREIFGRAATAIAGPDTAMAVEGISGAYVMNKGERLPLILDGGCGVLEMSFDLKTQTLIMSQAADVKVPLRDVPAATAWCHGYA